jgi:hypothetical protein
MAESETKESQPAADNQSVQLGMGTLIIIALIVSMCSGRGEMEKVQKDTAEVKQRLGAIERKLDTLVPQGSSGTSAGTDDATAAGPEAVEAPSGNP